MVVIPFIYFSGLLLLVYRRNKKRFDIACFILLIYALSAFSSIFIELFGLRSDIANYEISLSATIAYCGLLTLCLFPFIHFSNTSILKLSKLPNGGLLLKIIAVASFFFTFIAIFFSWKDIVFSLTTDISTLRREHYLGTSGTEIWYGSFPTGVKQLCILLNIMFSVPWIMHFLAFYSLCVQRLNKTYTVFLFFGSLISLITIILDAGRSGFVYWIFSLGACFVFFSPYYSKNDKKLLKGLSAPVLFLLFLYIFIVTISRFGEDEDGSGNSLIIYAGQSYIYFCYFFDTFTCPIPTLQNILPLSYYLVGASMGNPEEIQQLISQTTGESLGVFYTFIGQIASSSNNIIAIIYCFIFFVVFQFAFRNKKPRIMRIRGAFFYLFGASVMFLGLFGHYYAVWSRTLAIFLYLILFTLVSSKKIK